MPDADACRMVVHCRMCGGVLAGAAVCLLRARIAVRPSHVRVGRSTGKWLSGACCGRGEGAGCGVGWRRVIPVPPGSALYVAQLKQGWQGPLHPGSGVDMSMTTKRL